MRPLFHVEYCTFTDTDTLSIDFVSDPVLLTGVIDHTNDVAPERFQTQVERWAEEPAVARHESAELAPAVETTCTATADGGGGTTVAAGGGATAEHSGLVDAAGSAATAAETGAAAAAAAAEAGSGATSEDEADIGDTGDTATVETGAAVAAAEAGSGATAGAGSPSAAEDCGAAAAVQTAGDNAATDAAGSGAAAETGGAAAAGDVGTTAEAGGAMMAQAGGASAEAGGGAVAADSSAAALAVTGSPTQGGRATDRRQRTLQEGPPLQRPLELRVRLGGEEELPAALAAIQFAYTGHIEAGSIREVLQVWKQADYLQMKGCVEACVDALREKLGGAVEAAAASAAQPPAQAAASTVEATAPPVLQLYGCTQLWPDPEHEPAFAALLTEAKPQLVAHFGDALAVLNKKELYDQMLALPAVGMEALLESDDFGTDSESSVVLLLAEWIDANHGRADAATRRRLCGLLRLALCDRTYLDWVLPALALDHLLHPDTQAGCFPITPAQAGCIACFAGASMAVRSTFHSRPQETGCPTCWLNTTPRRSAVPPDGHSYAFSAAQSVLCEAFAAAEGDDLGHVFPEVEGTVDGNLRAMGLEWYLTITCRAPGLARPGLWLTPFLPDAVAGSSLAGLWRPVQMLRCRVHLEVAVGVTRGQPDHEMVLPCTAPNTTGWLGRAYGGVDIKLADGPAPVPRPEPAQQQGAAADPGRLGEAQDRRAREAEVAVQWARYLKDGRLRGKIEVLP
ncbi:hypothetical protein HYH02_011081 [Chlamydomonas schloesseri]|uniref:BACK domain-containing protein n=1 Tax=Chlamydomonas schloesseri TaxID=2026947 RepID=A0A835T7I6_9CHLO|nr:hypothetical protein HYH02_011081 [Chlamydomonas schloesseri]|eukprot:KAG2437703.1 hypothetical protein HYH02_011081 [Chlamydomonas schloesseri]